MLNYVYVADPRQLAFAVGLLGTLGASCLVIGVVAIVTKIDDFRWHRERKVRGTAAESKAVRSFVQSMLVEWAWPFSMMVRTLDGQEQRVYGRLETNQPHERWEVYSPVWTSADGALDSRKREKLRAEGFVLWGHEEIGRHVRLPPCANADDFMFVVRRVCQEAYDRRQSLKNETVS